MRKVAKRTRKKTQTPVESSPIDVEQGSQPAKTGMPFWQKALRFVGWGVLYLFVFYLGNLSGEYVAAHLPVMPTVPSVSWNMESVANRLPKFALPNISVSWNWPTMPQKDDTPTEGGSQLVIIGGKVISMPLGNATTEEKEAFAGIINDMAVAGVETSLNNSCEFAPAFLRVKSDGKVALKNTDRQAHHVGFGSAPVKEVASNNQVFFPVGEKPGIYTMTCDGTISGFFIVE